MKVKNKEPKYKILRYYKEEGKKTKVVKKNLSLAEARSHCSNPKSQGKTWFDGFTKQ